MVTDYEMLVQRIRVGHPEDTATEMIRLLDQVVETTKVEQARRDSELMQMLSDRAPDTKPPAGGTNSKSVYGSAAQILNLDDLGWSLNLPDHLK